MDGSCTAVSSSTELPSRPPERTRVETGPAHLRASVRNDVRQETRRSSSRHTFSKRSGTPAYDAKAMGTRTHVARITVVCLIGLAASSCSSTSTTSGNPSPSPSSAPASLLAPVHGSYSPSIDPSNFVAEVTNAYWPLLPGTEYRYQGVRGQTPQMDDEVVTDQTKQFLGIACTVV